MPGFHSGLSQEPVASPTQVFIVLPVPGSFWQFLLFDEDFYQHPEVSVMTKDFSTVRRGWGIWNGREEVLLYLGRPV